MLTSSPVLGRGAGRSPGATSATGTVTPAALLTNVADGSAISLGSLYAGDIGSGLTLSGKTGVTIDASTLSGGVVLTGWVNNPSDAIMSRIPAGARANVWRARVSTAFTSFGSPTLLHGTDNLSNATAAYMNELVIGGVPQTLCRYPNSDDDWLAIDEVGVGVYDAFTVEAADNTRMSAYSSIGGGLVTGFPTSATYWYVSTPMDELVDSSLTFTALPSTVTSSGRWRIENIPEELDSAGEYYFDTSTGYVYWYSSGANPNTLDTVLSYVSAGPLLTLLNCTDCSVTNSHFHSTRHGAILVSGGSGNTIDGCTIKATGLYGIKSTGATTTTVSDCTLTDIGEGAISVLAGDLTASTSPTSGGCRIENCTITRPARVYKTYKGAIMLGGCGTVVENVTASDGWGSAVTFLGSGANLIPAVNDMQIRNSTFTGFCQQVTDAGVLYHYETSTSRGNHVYNCRFEDCNAYDPEVGSVRVAGIYLDSSPGWRIENCFFSGNDCGIQHNGGRYIEVLGCEFQGSLQWGIVTNGYVTSQGADAGQLANWRRFTIETLSTNSFNVTTTGTSNDQGDATLDVSALSATLWANAILHSTELYTVTAEAAASATSVAVSPVLTAEIAAGTVYKVNGSQYYSYGKGNLAYVANYTTWSAYVPTHLPGYAGYADMVTAFNATANDAYRRPVGTRYVNNVFSTGIAEAKRVYQGAYWSDISAYVTETGTSTTEPEL